MPTKIEIEGVGVVELDDSFAQMSPQEQEATVSQIVAEAQRKHGPANRSTPNLSRIKRNVSKMIDMGAPEADIDAYLVEEGVTAEQLRADPSRPSAPPRSLHASPTPDGRSVIENLFPGAHVTDWKRGADTPLGKANPNSWHIRSGAAVDVRPIPGMSYSDFIKRLQDAGYPIIEQRDEVTNPARHATGKHWHVVIGQRPGDDEQAAALLETPAGSGPSQPDATFPNANEPSPHSQEVPTKPDRTSTLGAFGLGALDGVSFGFDDEIGGGIAALIPGLGRSSVWDGKSLSEAANENIDAYRDVKEAAEDEHFGAFVGGGLAGALVPIGGALGSAKALGTLGKLGASARTGAIAGAAYGAGSDTGGITDRLDGATLGAATGAVGGAGLHGAAKAGEAVLSPLARRLFPKLADARFAREQIGNPYAMTDAKVANDLNKIVRTLSSGSAKAKLSKGQRSTLLSRLNDLEASYLPAAELKALDVPPSVKARLNAAMAKRHLLSDQEVQALRDGTPAGEAVAEGIEKARRLRAYVPEGQGGGGRSLAGTLGDAVGSTAGYKFGGPIGGAIGGTLGRAITQRLDAKAAKEALALAEKATSFAKLPEVLAAKEAGKDGDALTRLSADALDARYNAERAAKQETERLTAEGRKVAIANARDNVRPGGGYRGELYERTGLLPAEQDSGALKALMDGAITPDQFQAHLDDPAKLMPGNAGNSLMDRLGGMADDGTLKRDPKWTPPASPSRIGREAAQAAFDEADALLRQAQDADAALFKRTGFDRTQRPTASAVDEAFAKREQAKQALRSAETTIRNPLAYAAAARGNQQRVSNSLSSLLDDPALPSDARESLATAVTAIGNTSNRQRAQGIAMDALDRLSADHRDYGRSLLAPLVEQIKR